MCTRTCVHVCIEGGHVPQHTCWIQRTTQRRNQFSLYRVGPDIELRLSWLMANAFPAISSLLLPSLAALSHCSLVSSSAAPLLFSCPFFFLYDHMSLIVVVYRCLNSLWVAITQVKFSPCSTRSYIAHLLPAMDRSNSVQVITTAVSPQPKSLWCPAVSIPPRPTSPPLAPLFSLLHLLWCSLRLGWGDIGVPFRLNTYYSQYYEFL